MKVCALRRSTEEVRMIASESIFLPLSTNSCSNIERAHFIIHPPSLGTTLVYPVTAPLWSRLGYSGRGGSRTRPSTIFGAESIKIPQAVKRGTQRRVTNSRRTWQM